MCNATCLVHDDRRAPRGSAEAAMVSVDEEEKQGVCGVPRRQQQAAPADNFPK